jgi:hypothetical protein
MIVIGRHFSGFPTTNKVILIIESLSVYAVPLTYGGRITIEFYTQNTCPRSEFLEGILF